MSTAGQGGNGKSAKERTAQDSSGKSEPTDPGQETLGLTAPWGHSTPQTSRYVYACACVCAHTCVCVYPHMHCIPGQGDYTNLKLNHFSHGKQPAGNTSGTESTTKRCQSQQRCLSHSRTIPLVSATKTVGWEKATHHPTTLPWGLVRPVLRAISEPRRPGWGLT